MTTDERGGGIVPGGASCTPGADNARGNGGVHFFPIANFTTNTPLNAEQAQSCGRRRPRASRRSTARTIRTAPQGSFCTAHVFQQIPGQNRIFMGWYSQGTQVFDFTENADGTLDFNEAGWFTPENANTWVSHIFKAERNADGTFTYWGAASDGILPGTGRGAIDVYKVTLPPPPSPLGGPAPGTPEFPLSDRGGAAPRACATSTAFERAAVARRGRRGLRFDFRRRGTARGDRRPVPPVGGPERHRRAARPALRAADALVLAGTAAAGGVRDGFYFARFSTRTARGRHDVRRVALLRRDGRWSVRPQFYRRQSCELVRGVKLSRPVFGGGGRARWGSLQPAPRGGGRASRSASAAASSGASPSAATSPTGRSASASPPRQARAARRRDGDDPRDADRAETETQTLTARKL